MEVLRFRCLLAAEEKDGKCGLGAVRVVFSAEHFVFYKVKVIFADDIHLKPQNNVRAQTYNSSE